MEPSFEAQKKEAPLAGATEAEIDSALDNMQAEAPPMAFEGKTESPKLVAEMKYKERQENVQRILKQAEEEDQAAISNIRGRLGLPDLHASASKTKAVEFGTEASQEFRNLGRTVDTANLGMGSDTVKRGGTLEKPMDVMTGSGASTASFSGIEAAAPLDEQPAIFNLADMRARETARKARQAESAQSLKKAA